MSILIKDVLLDGKETSIYIEGNSIAGIEGNSQADETIDGRGMAALPGLINTHSHAAMTLFRGYGDDMKLQQWLEEKIWPIEGKLTEEDVYWGAKLACLEMIKSGTTSFNDMYWHLPGTVRAVEEMGIRAVLSPVFIDLFDEHKRKGVIKEHTKLLNDVKAKGSERIMPALGPHALYTVSKEGLQWCKEFAEKKNLLIHFHLAETEQENKDCVEKNGKRPVEYLEEIGFLCDRIVAAHCNWLNGKDMKILAKHGVNIAHNPASNMKLATGVMPYPEMVKAGLTISLGTDGCASNNSLDMFEEMKFAALLQKSARNDPTAMPAGEAWKMATISGARALGLNAGVIKEGMLADIMLVNLKKVGLAPSHNLISNLVYSANGSCVDTVICNGRILMQERRVESEDEIIQKASEVAMNLAQR
ncbi:MAG: amidohydrolase [Candidatus Altiarchaeales archaeon]|nr:amidohydrolase [Candidatus Altiarchaeota archaeon]MBU4266599.1 amidohydrolase [Candidatus Altiarchaeota archaeon]MBU4437192.1 amidohydrolase [Candidatus Altiarchaeota archaeon]MCG2783114.1 amidohydrolase [Candidatus Altiarchaeales archaeon]